MYQFKVAELLKAVGVCVMLSTAVSGCATHSPADNYLDLVQKAIHQTRDDLQEIIPLAEKCADEMIATGSIGSYPNPVWGTSEMVGRAGSIMGVKWQSKPEQKGVLLYFPSAKCEDLEKLLSGNARVYAICPREVLERARDAQGRPYDLTKLAGIVGGPLPEEGLYPDNQGVLTAPVYRMGQLIRGWAFIGEVVAACTRKGKMPMIWKSVMLPDAQAWNAPLQEKLKKGVIFHDDLAVQAIPAGHIAKTYLGVISRDVDSLRHCAPAFRKAGQAMAQALREDHKVHVWISGHAFPGLLESRPIYQMPSYFVDYEKGVKAKLQTGDAQILIPYRNVPNEPLAGALDKGWTVVGARSVPPELTVHPKVITFQANWSSGDAVVPIEGYPAKVLPDSSVVQATAFFCMAAEMGAAEQEREKASQPQPQRAMPE